MDISEAFDLVSLEYIFELLEKRGYPPRWKDWFGPHLHFFYIFGASQ
jgi:hypothetical protein